MIAIPKGRRPANTMFLVKRIEALGVSLANTASRYQKYEEAYGVKFDEHWRQAVKLLVREREFGDEPSVESSKKLDDDWNAWADGLLRSLQDARLDLKCDKEERALRQFVDARTLSRAPLL